MMQGKQPPQRWGGESRTHDVLGGKFSALTIRPALGQLSFLKGKW